MTDEERAALKDELKGLSDAQAAIEAASKPFDDALRAIEQVRDALLERHGVEIAGECETCERLLFAGDKGHVCGDGPVLCEDCSPTYADLQKQLLERSQSGGFSEDDLQEQRDSLAAYLSAGGDPGAKIVHTL